jgi:RimJ/RimL family protein N-acetyltransferase
MSSLLWDIDWSSQLPVDLGEGARVRLGTYDECIPFVRENYARIFEADEESPFPMARLDPMKERYYRIAGDFFAFDVDGRMVGLLVCTPADFSSYYIRSAGALPRYVGSGLVPSFLPVLFRILKQAGVERVEADTSPSNLAVIRILTRMAFNVTGTLLTDRWGAHVHLTRYLADAPEEVFLRQFCSGVKYQRRASSAT